jgi:galactose mutarotase-like enzyme
VEYAWQGDEQYWSGRNPTLFPIVGKLWQETYHLNKRQFHLGNHGFARHETFKLTSKTRDTLVLTLTDTPETLTHYPFHFRLTNTYTLNERSLTITSTVFNPGQNELPFSMGAHPAFNCPQLEKEKFTDYKIVFAQAEDLTRLVMNPIDSSFLLERQNYGHQVKELPLTPELFTQDVLAFEGLASAWVALVGPKTRIQITTNHAPWFGLWTKPGAPFICLEPWQGHGDFANFDGDFCQREGTILLPAGVEFDFTYAIEVS